MPDLVSLRPGDPERVGEYRLIGRLGQGGQGTVFLGESPAGARVAVKLLRADLAQDEEAMERFVREVSTTRRVAPFCTAAVIDTGVDHHRPYIISEYIDGPTLNAVVATEGPREGPALHRLAIGTVTALVAIHRAGIVHRDFKPANVLLAADGPRVIDFGIARALDRTSTLTTAVIGTPSYMAPEQFAGENAGSSTDMFAWGCTMVFAATGRPPFGADSLPAILNRVMNLEPDLRAITDPVLRELVGQCLVKDAALRPAAEEALLRLLHQAGDAPSPAATGDILAEGSMATRQKGTGARSPSRPAWKGRRQEPDRRQAVSRLHGDPVHPPYPAEGAAGRGRRVQIAIGAGLAVTLVTAAGIALASRDTTPDRVVSARANGTGQAAASPSGSPTPTVSALPQATRTIKLPHSSITLHESDDDLFKMSFYTTEKNQNLYVRTPGIENFSRNFTETKTYVQYAVNADGTRALATGELDDDGRYSTVSVIGRRPGSTEKIRIAKAPVFPFAPEWSPDGTRGLTTLYEVSGGETKKQAYTFKKYGYAIIDIARRKAHVVRLKKAEDEVVHYFWRGDGQAIGVWTGTDRDSYVRFYDLQGTVLYTLPDVGIPLDNNGRSISPSGTLIVTYCADTSENACVWTIDSRMRDRVKIPFEEGQFIGWYDERHLAGWRRTDDGHEAVVIDLQGQVKRVLAVVSNSSEYGEQAFHYSRAR